MLWFDRNRSVAMSARATRQRRRATAQEAADEPPGSPTGPSEAHDNDGSRGGLAPASPPPPLLSIQSAHAASARGNPAPGRAAADHSSPTSSPRGAAAAAAGSMTALLSPGLHGNDEVRLLCAVAMGSRGQGRNTEIVHRDETNPQNAPDAPPPTPVAVPRVHPATLQARYAAVWPHVLRAVPGAVGREQHCGREEVSRGVRSASVRLAPHQHRGGEAH